MRGRAAHTNQQAGTAAEQSSIRSPVSWALLGLLIERSGYGYALVKRFEREYGDALAIKSNFHIYRALDSLQGKGLIEAIELPASDTPTERQPRVRYRATERGVASYVDWLTQQAGASRRQAHAFVRQLAVLATRPTLALAILEVQERACLSAPRTETAEPNSAPAADAATLTRRLLAEEARLALAATLPWIQYARVEFERLAAEQRSSDGDT